MRTSCNGCRVLRKGCSDDCAIRPCLTWIKSPEAQANATVFLAKFYGRAGLLNLLNAGPENLRPAVFQSLLYEACGRVVDPVYGSVGLLSTSQWQNCQVAVNSVLNGVRIDAIPQSTPNDVCNNGPAHQMTPPTMQLYDIRHMSSPSTPLQTRTRHRRTPRVPVEGLDRVSMNGGGDEEEDNGNHSMFSAETSTDGSMAGQMGESELGLELTLGLFNNSG